MQNYSLISLKKCEGGSGFLRSIIMSPDMKSFEVEFEDGAEKKKIFSKRFAI